MQIRQLELCLNAILFFSSGKNVNASHGLNCQQLLSASVWIFLSRDESCSKNIFLYSGRHRLDACSLQRRSCAPHQRHPNTKTYDRDTLVELF